MERTTYMTNLMTSTYPNIAPEAVMNGFDGAWERLIAAKLLKDYERGHSESEELMNYFF